MKPVPITHASLVLNWNGTIIYVDPVESPSLYDSQPKPDIVLITHEHQDHFDPSTLSALVNPTTILVVNPSVAEKLPDDLKHNVVIMRNGETQILNELTINAIPAHNTREEAQKYHPPGRDNGYVLDKDGTRVYIAGDTEGIPEMRALQNIDIAFVPMNLPYTMPVEDAAEAVLAFKPKTVYPYHYRTPEGFSDVQKFKQLVNASDENIEVILANWYPAQ
jgi:L-ascorbate metabolism protein UlaG (beta-lactamase superfamily)